MNVYQKIAAVMADVQYLAKDDSVEFKSTRYKAISEEKVTSIMRAALLKHGLVVFPVEQHRERVGQITSVDVKYRLQNIDDPEDYVIVCSSGDGADTQDKGAGKAMTYAFKYMFLRTFAIPTGEDPDKVSSAQLDDEAARAAEKENPKINKDHWDGLCNTYLAVFGKAPTKKTLAEFTGMTYEEAREMSVTEWTFLMDKLDRMGRRGTAD